MVCCNCGAAGTTWTSTRRTWSRASRTHTTPPAAADARAPCCRQHQRRWAADAHAPCMHRAVISTSPPRVSRAACAHVKPFGVPGPITAAQVRFHQAAEGATPRHARPADRGPRRNQELDEPHGEFINPRVAGYSISSACLRVRPMMCTCRCLGCWGTTGRWWPPPLSAHALCVTVADDTLGPAPFSPEILLCRDEQNELANLRTLPTPAFDPTCSRSVDLTILQRVTPAARQRGERHAQRVRDNAQCNHPRGAGNMLVPVACAHVCPIGVHRASGYV